MVVAYEFYFDMNVCIIKPIVLYYCANFQLSSSNRSLIKNCQITKSGEPTMSLKRFHFIHQF